MLDFKKIVHKPGHFQIHFSILGKIMFLCKRFTSVFMYYSSFQICCHNIVKTQTYSIIFFTETHVYISFLDKIIPTQNMYYSPFKWNKPYLDWSLFDDCINFCISFQTQSSSIPECRKLNCICTQYDNISIWHKYVTARNKRHKTEYLYLSHFHITYYNLKHIIYLNCVLF